MKTYTYTARAKLDTGEPAAMSGTVKACCLQCALWEAVAKARLSYADFHGGAWVEVKDPDNGATKNIGKPERVA